MLGPVLAAVTALTVGAPEAVAPDIWLIPGSLTPGHQPDGNTVVIDGPRGLVVLDTGRHATHTDAILAFAKTRERPIVAIVNSHWHLDHVSGNPAMKRAFPKARIYASSAIDAALTGFLAKSAAGMRVSLASGKLSPASREEQAGDLVTIDNGQALRPDVVVARSATRSLAGRRIEVNLARNAATAGDVWLYDRATHVAAVGDLVTLPAPFLDTACALGWSAALDQVWAKPFTRLVPGHGPVMNRDDFALYRTAFRAMIDCARSSRPDTECADDWSKAVAPLQGPDPIGPRLAPGMAQYYVTEVLRGGGEAKVGCPAGTSSASAASPARPD
jgi:glyoxylase-like metal-dependent hydrolase (beta-lactamase superfamily II)